MGYKYRQHHERFARHVEAVGLFCQECGGTGAILEEYIEEYARYEECMWCEGTGRIPRHTRGVWLNEQRRIKS